MQFKAVDNPNRIESELTYVKNGLSFDTDPIVKSSDFSLILNDLTLTVVDKRIVQIWGYCPYQSWQETQFNVPDHKPGELIIETHFEPGLAYGINERKWPAYVNKKTGWVCIGNPKLVGSTVEFMTGCVAVLEEGGDLVALWLKPKTLPI